MKVAVIVGHTNEAKGARMADPYSYIQEYEFNKVVAAAIYTCFYKVKIPCHVFTRDVGFHETYRQAGRWGADMSVELHFNASAPEHKGCCVLYGEQKGSVELAHHIQGWVYDCLDNRNRGIRRLEKGDRGYANVNTLSIPQVLVEPFFGSNPEECSNAVENMWLLANSIADGCIDYMSDDPTTKSLQ